MKKLLRSLLVRAPWIQDARFAAEVRVLRWMNRPFRPEYAGLRAFAVGAPLVVDIGCNRGVSISTIRSMMPTARIVGYEPNPDLAAATASRFAGDTGVDIRTAALGQSEEERTLYLPVYRGYRFDGFASFERDLAIGLFDDRLLYALDRSRLVIEERRVRVRRFDDERLDPLVLKLYVQGHERPVLEGATETLRRCEPVVVAPSCHAPVDAFLREHGYRRYQWVDGRFEPEVDRGYVVYYMTARRAAQAMRPAA